MLAETARLNRAPSKLIYETTSTNQRKAYASFGSSSLSYTHNKTAVATPTAMMTHHISDGSCLTSP
jgi:hypothetical protein